MYLYSTINILYSVKIKKKGGENSLNLSSGNVPGRLHLERELVRAFRFEREEVSLNERVIKRYLLLLNGFITAAEE